MHTLEQTAERTKVAFFISAFGLVSTALALTHGVRVEPVSSALFGVVPPLIVSLGFVGLGVRLARRQYERRWLKLLQRWHLIGALGGGLIALLFVGYQSAHGIALVHPEYVLYNTVVGGAGIGAVFGYRSLKVRRGAGPVSSEAVERRDRQSALLDGMGDAALVYSLEEESLIAVNQIAVDRLGYSRDELRSMHPSEFHADDVDDLDVERVPQHGTENQHVFETVHETATGERLPVEINATRVTYQDEPAVLAVARDVRERTARERRLRSYHEALDHAGHAIYITDTDGTIEYVNPAFERQTGYDAVEAVGETPQLLQSGYHDDAFYEELWETILDGEVWHNEEMIDQRKDGTEYYVDQTIAPITSDDGEIERFVAVAQDITELKEHEERLESQRSQLELFNRILRHDVRNDMQIVLGRSRLLEERLPAKPGYERSIRSIIDHGEHVVELTRTVRNLIEVVLEDEHPEREPIALTSALEGPIGDLCSEEDAVTVTVEGELPPTRVSATDMLESVFRNVLTNAVQHNDRSEPSVTVAATERDETVEVRVADNGPGVPDDRKADVFEQGERGLESDGTGIGLYLVRTLVESYGGSVRIEDNEPDGAVTVVELPTATGDGSR